MAERRVFSSIRTKIITIFAALLFSMAAICIVFSVLTFWKGYDSQNQKYLTDITGQITNNVKDKVSMVDNKSVKILSSEVVQKQLRKINNVDLSLYELTQCQEKIRSEITAEALYDEYVISTRVVSLNGIESSVKRISSNEGIPGFSEKEIYQANGRALWTLLQDGTCISMVRAILDLETMMPIGYVNFVYDNHLIGDIISENSTKAGADTFLIDQSRKIIASSDPSTTGSIYKESADDLRARIQDGHDRENKYYIGETMMNGWTLVQVISHKDFYSTFYRMILYIISFSIVILGIGLLLIIIVTRHITKPTQELLKSMKAFSEANKYQRVRINGNDEFAQIGNEYNRMVQHIEVLIERILKMDIVQQQAEIEFLRMQINPHFLYNTLDSINWMAIEANNTEISDMIVALADLLRATITKDSYIRLKDELETTESYLQIEKSRFGDKISYEIQVSEELKENLVPNLLLQPIIENAIIHGLEPKIGPGKLLVCVIADGMYMLFNVKDDGIGMPEEEVDALMKECRKSDGGRTIGLKNVYRRLLLYYGQDSVLHIESCPGRGTSVSFRIPIKRA